MRILVIEDDRFLLKLYSDKLKRAGFLVFEALTGEEGMNKILAEDPDLIILDSVLPGKNGFEVLSELKSNDKTNRIPVLVLTNLENAADIEKAGAGVIIRKNRKELAGAITRFNPKDSEKYLGVNYKEFAKKKKEMLEQIKKAQNAK